jgi:hypothetical protein
LNGYWWYSPIQTDPYGRNWHLPWNVARLPQRCPRRNGTSPDRAYASGFRIQLGVQHIEVWYMYHTLYELLYIEYVYNDTINKHDDTKTITIAITAIALMYIYMFASYDTKYILYCIIYNYIYILYYIVLYCIILHYIALYCIILSYIVLYCIILYYIVCSRNIFLYTCICQFHDGLHQNQGCLGRSHQDAVGDDLCPSLSKLASLNLSSWADGSKWDLKRWPHEEYEDSYDSKHILLIEFSLWLAARLLEMATEREREI